MTGDPLTVQQLLASVLDVRNRFPLGRVVKNEVGNLAITEGGVYRGFLDLATGEVLLWSAAGLQEGPTK